MFSDLSGFQSVLVKWSLFTVVLRCKRGDSDAERGELPCEERWERAVGKHHAQMLALWGEAAATGTSPTQSGPKAPLMLNKISVREAVSVHRTVVLVCVVNIFG